MSSKTLYDKGNSIVHLHGTSKSPVDIIERLARLRPIWERLESDDLAKLAILSLQSNDSSSLAKNCFFLREHVVEEMRRLSDDELIRYLRYRYSYDMFPVTKHLTLYPPLVQIEPTSVCNYRCVFCYQTDARLNKKANGHMGMMEMSLFKKIIDELVGKVEAITLASRGEPLIHPNIDEMLNYVSGKFLAVKVNTNASLLDERLSRVILKSNIQTLVFSVDADSDPLYSKLRVNGNFEKVHSNIKRFHEIKAEEFPESRLIIRVSGVEYGEEQKIDTMNSVWKKFADQVAFVEYNPWETVYDSALSEISTPCSDLWRRMFIWWDGRTCPCDVDYLTTLMNDSVVAKTVAEIWGGSQYEALRKNHLSGKRSSLSPCNKCVVI